MRAQQSEREFVLQASKEVDHAYANVTINSNSIPDNYTLYWFVLFREKVFFLYFKLSTRVLKTRLHFEHLKCTRIFMNFFTVHQYSA